MVRPQKDRFVAFKPNTSYFKPRGIPMLDLDEVRLTVDEREAIRLSDLQGLSHEEAGRCMGVSRATFGRIIQRARKAVADAIINGKAINIEGGNFKMVDAARFFQCHHCSHHWEEPRGTGRPQGCPQCGRAEFHRVMSTGNQPAPPL
ncbi:MAG: DUF134 domain-containing protein [Desulfobacterales bacterium]